MKYFYVVLYWGTYEGNVVILKVDYAYAKY